MKYDSARRSELRRAEWAALTSDQRKHRARGLTAWNSTNGLRRKYAVDETYFDQIDTPDKAYWLGFIAGDGCVLADGTLRVNLAPVDVGQLEKLAAALGSDAPIRHGTTRLHGKTFKRVILNVYCLHMTQALERQGIVPRKTWRMEPWDGPEYLMRHYWRGMVDADGSLSAVDPFSVRLIGTEAVAAAFAEWMRGIRPSLSIRSTHKRGILWGAGASGRLGAQAIAGALYGGCTVALARKAERATALLAALPPIGPARDDMSPEAHALRSAFHAGQIPSQANRDAHRTPEARERARLRNLGRKDTAAARQNKSDAQRRRYEDPAAREKAGRASREAAARRRAERIAAGLIPSPVVRDPRCRTCGADISHRAAQARFCEQCRPVKAK